MQKLMKTKLQSFTEQENYKTINGDIYIVLGWELSTV